MTGKCGYLYMYVYTVLLVLTVRPLSQGHRFWSSNWIDFVVKLDKYQTQVYRLALVSTALPVVVIIQFDNKQHKQMVKSIETITEFFKRRQLIQYDHFKRIPENRRLAKNGRHHLSENWRWPNLSWRKRIKRQLGMFPNWWTMQEKFRNRGAAI